MNQALIDYYRCPEEFAEFVLAGTLSEASGYFRFGGNTICYGQCSAGFLAPKPTDGLYDALDDVTTSGSATRLPFDPKQAVENLRHERYFSNPSRVQPKRALESIIRDAYYLLRPVMPVPIRRYVQRIHLRDWHRIPFPHWPVDRTVDHIMETLMRLSMKSRRIERIPFIWFWPEGAPGCATVTHDVETTLGRDFSSPLMDLNDEYGIKTSFQIVPEKRYTVSANYLDSIRSRGFEVNIQDLNHDGRLFRDRKEFLHRVERINKYAKEFGAKGFRAGVLYRNVDWYDAFEVDYDMSLPNVAHLDPQRGGCCTVMPYFIGKILELPVTTTQDYSLFQILCDYSIELWKQQMALILEKNGFISFIVHPDYITSKRAQGTYRELLSYLVQLRSQRKIWIALPGEVNHWWRERRQMKLVRDGNTWRIEGPGAERARVAYAEMEGERVIYNIEPRSPEHKGVSLAETHGSLGCRVSSSPADLRVVEINYRIDARWENFLASHPHALFYHHPAWLQALEAEYGQPCIGLACENGQGELLGLLPLSYTRGLPFRLGEHETGRRLSSLPRTPMAGPITTNGKAATALVQAALNKALAGPRVQLELRMPVEISRENIQGLFPKPWRFTYVVELPDKPDKLRFGDSRNHSRIKWAVNKANRMGLRVRSAESESDLRAWYRLYLETMRDNAVPPRPYRLFQALWAFTRSRDLMWLLLAEQHEAGKKRLVAGSLFLMFGQTIFYAFNGVNRHALPLRANDFLQWHALYQACVRGFRWYDLGEVPRDHVQLANFKSKWGAQPKRLFRYYHPAPQEELDWASPTRRSRYFLEAWRRLPVSWTARIGDWLYSFM